MRIEHTAPGPNDGQPESNAIPESVAELIKQLQFDLELQGEFFQHLQRDGREFDEYGYRWLRDGHGRVIGVEEQWQFHIDELREFFQHKQRVRKHD